ncbi:hypothetical protein ACEPAF_247 [Sanghuangporus sanghuang]
MQDTQLSEHSINTAFNPVDEKDEDSSSLRDQLNEQVRTELENVEHDDGQVEPEVIATPNIWSRFRKILLILAAVWLALAILRGSGRQRPKVVHARRYSESYKFRPAASPIVTETLKDGRIRIRGAEPTARSTPSATPKSKTRKRRARKRRKTKSRD